MQIEKIRRIVEEKSKQNHLSIRSIAKNGGIKSHSQISRILSGQTTPTPSMLAKLCEGLGCTREERIEIFHAAGYLAPDEAEEESASVASKAA